MSEFEGGSVAPAPDPQLAAQLSGPWMKALLAGEDEAEGTDLFSALAPPAPAPPAPGEAPELLPDMPSPFPCFQIKRRSLAYAAGSTPFTGTSRA